MAWYNVHVHVRVCNPINSAMQKDIWLSPGTVTRNGCPQKQALETTKFQRQHQLFKVSSFKNGQTSHLIYIVHVQYNIPQ